ncbi:MAG: CoA transferase [Actinomycetota bacterium]|nr:CoA transferase [Actinomycetota bacterium]
MGDLDGVTVLQCVGDLAPSYCAKLLGDSGAEVTLVEPPGGDALRSWSCAPEPAGGGGALFDFLHQGHRSVTDDPARRHARLDGADIVVAPPAGPLGAAALAAARPGLVVVTITPFGLGGPYAGRPASDLTIQAESGALACRGTADRPPVQMGGRVVEWVAGAYAAFAALAAERRQADTGHGDLIDVSLCEVANLTGTLYAAVSHSLGGSRPIDPARPSRSVELPSIEPTLDGWVGFNTNTRQQFESFCLLIERPDLISDEWASVATRVARADEWNAAVRAWTSRHTTADVVERASVLRIPVGPVCDGPGVLELEQVRARALVVTDPSGRMSVPVRPWYYEGEPRPAAGPAPSPGQHDSEFRPPRGARPEPGSGAAMPLAGIRVVDMTAWWAGPSATGLFAALGAEVVHVESTRRPDGMRMSGGMFAATQRQWWEYSGFFLQANANKLGVTLDLDTVEGRALLLRLVEKADLVVENFTPRVLESFDLAWDVIHATNPRAVMVRMPAFGLDGPWRDRPGFAQTMEQVTGLAWVTGHRDDQPRIQRGPCDPNGGLHAAIAALNGLRRRDATGVGSLIVAPMFDAALNVAAELLIEWTAYGHRMGRDGNRGPGGAPQGLYACAGPEQWLAVSVTDDRQWAALAAAMDRPDLVARPDLATEAGRRAAHDELDRAIGAWAAGRTLADAVDELVAAGVPAAPARDARRAATHPQFRARAYFEQTDHPVVGCHPVPGQPWRSRGVDRWIRSPAPSLGEDNEAVLGGWLGCDGPALGRLTAEGVIGTWPAGA